MPRLSATQDTTDKASRLSLLADRFSRSGWIPTSTSGNKWIVVATDYHTRNAETKALLKGNAAEVAKFFVKNILLRHGAPEVLITDKGTAFTAELTQAIVQYTRRRMVLRSG